MAALYTLVRSGPPAIVFHIYTGLAFLYVFWRLILPLPLPRIWRALIAVLLLVVSKYHYILVLIFGNMFAPEIPRPWLLLASGSFFVFVLLFVFTLVSDVVIVIARLARRRWNRPAWLTAVAFVAAIAVSAYGINQALAVPEVRRVEIAVKDLPPALEGYRLVQLTDLHISRLLEEKWAAAVVARAQALHPDLIVVTGDVIDGSVQDRASQVAPLAGLKAPDGVYAIAGNHEYYFDVAQWLNKFRELGMQTLANQHAVVETKGEKIVLAGITDQVAIRYGLPMPDLEAALAGVPQSHPLILLSHRPMGAADYAAHGVDLQLSGHTHGGMVPGLDQIVRRANEGYVAGLYRVGAMSLYVSRGTGLWNGFPVRLGVPSEITEFTLRKATSPQS